MAWQDEIVPLLRVFVNDSDATAYRYSDDRLELAVVAAARLVQQQLSFPVAYAVNVGSVSITPDPTVGDSRDESFINLVATKAACVIDRGAAGLAAGQAIMVQDGSSKVDLRDAFKANLSLLEKGWCAVYQEMAEEYITGQQGVTVGAAILTPFRLFAQNERPFLTGSRTGRFY